MKDPVDHILRPQLPWRSDAGITECGLNAERVPTINRAQYAERRKSMGQQRAAMFTCITCAQTVERWGTWEDDPRQALQREMELEGESWRRWRVRDELLAIAALIEEHRGEFEDLVLAVQQRREWLARKAAREETARAKPKRPEPW